MENEMFASETYTRNGDGTYGPTSRNHYYQPVSYHNRTSSSRPGKNKWIIKESEQYKVFRISDEPWWLCDTNNCLFSIVDNGNVILGQTTERLAKFPIPNNKTDPFHGYPVHCDQRQNRPDLGLLDRWQKEGIISPHLRNKIEKSQL
jgi:hypothetical protein